MISILKKKPMWAINYVRVPADTEDMDNSIHPFEERDLFRQPPPFWNMTVFSCHFPCIIKRYTGTEQEF